MAEIVNAINNTVISGTSSADVISNEGSNVTVNAGAGNDVVALTNGIERILQYGAGDGNDTILNFNFNDTLSITSGEIDSLYTDGNGSIRFKDKIGNAINVVDTDGNLTQKTAGNLLDGTYENDTLDNTLSNVLILPYGGDDVISLRGSQQIIDIDSGNDTIYGISADDVIHLGWFPEQAIRFTFRLQALIPKIWSTLAISKTILVM